MVKYWTLFKIALLKSNLVKSSWPNRGISTRRIHVSKRMTSSSANIARLCASRRAKISTSSILFGCMSLKGKQSLQKTSHPFRTEWSVMDQVVYKLQHSKQKRDDAGRGPCINKNIKRYWMNAVELVLGEVVRQTPSMERSRVEFMRASLP